MPPKVRFQKEDIVAAAVQITRQKGFSAVTAREVAAELGMSTRPIFSYFDTMDQLKDEVRQQARTLYRSYIERGLAEAIPFFGIWRNFLQFAREEPQLYKALFFGASGANASNAAETLEFSQGLARESIMQIYRMDAQAADCFFRNMWLVSLGFASLVVNGDCPYTDDEMFAIGAEMSLSICKAYKDIPGLPRGEYDRDAAFREIVGR